MSSMLERSYGKVLKTAFMAVNPIKKLIIKTECRVHKFINNQALIILKGDGLEDDYHFFNKYIEDLNSGVVWADQDLKSSNHFYSPDEKRGLYGNSNALKEAYSYYTACLTWWHRRDVRKAMFYLGAVCHLIQDTTVPQHVNVKLLKDHRRYEQWVIRTYEAHDSFKCFDKGIYKNSIKDFIEENARVAIDVHNRNRPVKDTEERFFNITDVILCQAQRSTAGMLHMFYSDKCGMKQKDSLC